MQCVLVTFFAPTALSPSTPTLFTLTSISTQLLVFIFFFLIHRLQFMLPNYFREGGSCLPGAEYFKEAPFSNRCQLLAFLSEGQCFVHLLSMLWLFFFLVWALAGPVHTVIFTVSLCVWLPYSVWKVLCAWTISGSGSGSASLPGRRFLSLE